MLSTNKQVRWTIPPDACIPTSTLCRRPLTRLGRICTASYISVRLPNSSINEHYFFFVETFQATPGPTAIDKPSALPGDGYRVTSAQVLRTQHSEELPILTRKVPTSLREQWRRYKRHLHTKVASMLKFRCGQLVYVDKQPLTASSHGL